MFTGPVGESDVFGNGGFAALVATDSGGDAVAGGGDGLAVAAGIAYRSSDSGLAACEAVV